jgi:hypothetical protein
MACCTAMRDATHHQLFSDWIKIPAYIWIGLLLMMLINYPWVSTRGVIAVKSQQDAMMLTDIVQNLIVMQANYGSLYPRKQGKQVA